MDESLRAHESVQASPKGIMCHIPSPENIVWPWEWNGIQLRTYTCPSVAADQSCTLISMTLQHKLKELIPRKI